MPDRVPTYTAAQVRAAEAPRLAAGVPLMARASSALAEIVRGMLPGGLDSARPRVLVLAGRGDNGGDALFAAALLTDVADVEVLLTGGGGHQEALAAAVAAGARVVDLPRIGAAEYDLAIDGIVGIGSSTDPALRGGARDAVAALLPAVRAGRTRVVAVDLPSGMQPDDGRVADDVVLPAEATVTFGGVKAGLTAAPALTGRIILVDLDLPLVASAAVGEADVEIHRPA
jgi:NAD(P)H-hydrate epimerase